MSSIFFNWKFLGYPNSINAMVLCIYTFSLNYLHILVINAFLKFLEFTHTKIKIYCPYKVNTYMDIKFYSWEFDLKLKIENELRNIYFQIWLKQIVLWKCVQKLDLWWDLNPPWLPYPQRRMFGQIVTRIDILRLQVGIPLEV